MFKVFRHLRSQNELHDHLAHVPVGDGGEVLENVTSIVCSCQRKCEIRVMILKYSPVVIEQGEFIVRVDQIRIRQTCMYNLFIE